MNRRQFISNYTRVNRALEVRFMPAVQRALQSKANAVIKELKSGGYEAAIRYVNTDFSNERLAKVIKEVYRITGVKHARLNYSRLLHDTGRKYTSVPMETKGFGFNTIWTNFVLDYLARFLFDKITFAVAQTTQAALLGALNRGIIQGFGVDQTIKILEDWPYARFQAARIIRTEVNRAANVGATAQEDTSRYEQVKEWVSVDDFRTRGRNPKDHANHHALNGVTIDAGDMFKDPRNGDLLQFPGDPNGKAESTINCRCSVAYNFKRDANGEPIPKRSTVVVRYPSQNRTGQIVTI